MFMHYRCIVLCVVVFSFSCVLSRKTHNTIASNTQVRTVTDTVKKEEKVSEHKAYHALITDKAITSRGLFTVHKINGKYFFEIPDSLLDKDILLVSRISQGPALGKSPAFGYAGDMIGESQIIFSKGPNNKLFIRLQAYYERSKDSSANGMFQAVKNSTLSPIVAAFDIKALRPDSAASVIEVTDFLNSDNHLLYFDAAVKSNLNLGGYQKDKSYVQSIKAYPINVELQTFNTYLRGDIPISLLLNASFVLLPAQPMQPRYYDNRVGYFSQSFFDYDIPDRVGKTEMITRWRLEPKDADKERYLNGELVEPKKPIVYYIDPATPKKWVPYLIQGVNDWNAAFEKAGFKNAIYALEAPKDDSSFNLFDARHNAIIYKASPFPNASGPQVCDPRTGEILETHINWYHNIISLMHDWYMVQAAPNDPGARKMVFDDTLVGQLIRFVCSHEVGHTLGLRHNMGASSTIPTDSLRSKSYLEKNGFCPSIMDYARFNYVAQPEDGLSREHLMPRIGVYDEWAIEWGYRWLPYLKTKEDEASYMNKWIISSLKKDKRLWWGEYEPGPLSAVDDPRRQSEDLGDDAIKASYYGILNLKRVMANLKEWAVEPNKDYEALSIMYKEVLDQYGRYMMHVVNNIGNKYVTNKKTGQDDGPVISFIPRDYQKKAVRFLGKELFNNNSWLYNRDIFGLIGGPAEYAALPIQRSVINWLVSQENFLTMNFAQMQQPKDAYSFDEFLTDFEKEIWKEIFSAKPISYPRRNLQRLYTERLLSYGVANPAMGSLFLDMSQIGVYPIFHKHMRYLVYNIDQVLSLYKDEASRLHLLDVKTRLTQALNYNRYGN